MKTAWPVRPAMVVLFTGLMSGAFLLAPAAQSKRQARESLVTTTHPSRTNRPKIDPAARGYFSHLVEHYGLFAPKTIEELDRSGLRTEYARLVRDCWKGRDEEGVSLELKATPGHTYRVGEAFHCRAFLTNHGSQARLLQTGGSCGMTDALSPYLISLKDGQLFNCRGADGGPHCFCRPTQSLVQPQETVEIVTGFDSKAAVPCIPEEPGDYVVVGRYYLEAPPGVAKIVYSPPLVVHVVAADK